MKNKSYWIWKAVMCLDVCIFFNDVWFVTKKEKYWRAGKWDSLWCSYMTKITYSKQLNCDLFHSKKKSFLVLFFFLFLRTKLTEREVLGSLMEQLMINTGESELEVQYKIAPRPMNSQSGRQRRTILSLVAGQLCILRVVKTTTTCSFREYGTRWRIDFVKMSTLTE